MTRRAVWVWTALLAAAVLFYFANRAAYKGYFSDDDLDNLGWPTFTASKTFYIGLITPKFLPDNFRPVGFLYYRIMGRTFGLNYSPYVTAVQAFHALNAILLFLILRRLNLPDIAAISGAVFYAFHAAVMEVYWKPMYVFDLLCGTLCLAALLLYIRGRWLLALPAFWLAYKSKETAVMLPLALLAYEWLLGQRKWKRLIPFFAVSLSFGLQALVYNLQMRPTDVYALNFTPQLLWRTVSFYSSSIFFAPFAGLALLTLPVFVRDRRLYLGLILTVSLLIPLVALSNRYAQAYWYVPLIGLGVAAGAVASRVPKWSLALFFILWLPLNYWMLRKTRNGILSRADEVRWYVTGLEDYARRLPPVKTVVFEATPPHMEPWGIKGAIKQVFGQQVDAVWFRDSGAAEALARVPVAIVAYYPVPHVVKGRLRTRNEIESRIDFRDNVPASQLGEGWYRANDASPVRRVVPKAEVMLYRPAGAHEFEISCYGAGPEEPCQVGISEDGHPLGTEISKDSKGQTLRWKLPGGPPGNRLITIVSKEVQRAPGDPTEYGVTVRQLGYVE